jgi:CBS domain-containing protein
MRKTWHVGDVMTTDVVTVGEDTPYREIVLTLAAHRISAVPVVDASRRVLGVVSESDLLPKVEAANGTDVRYLSHRHRRRLLDRRRRRAARAKAAGTVARDLMSAPAVTALPDTPIAVAARRMEQARVTRLPVENELGRLVGIVTRGDLLRVYQRPDADVCRDVVEEINRKVLAFEAGRVHVAVRDGVATLSGRTDRRSTAQFAVRVATEVPGVVHVLDELEYNIDDCDVPTWSAA